MSVCAKVGSVGPKLPKNSLVSLGLRLIEVATAKNCSDNLLCYNSIVCSIDW